jgi:hypothetical protein
MEDPPSPSIARQSASTPTLSPSQREMLSRLPASVPIEEIDRLWLFEPQVGKTRETGLLVLSLLPQEPLFSQQRRLLTLRYSAETLRGKLHREEVLSEEGRAPSERIERVIAGVLARTGEAAGEPFSEVISGSGERWLQVLQRLGVSG